MTCELNEGAVVECEGRLSVTVPIKMDSAAAVLAAAEPHVRARDCVLDLAGVTEVDSAALSVVLGLVRASRAAEHRFCVINPPAAFRSLAALYGVDEFIADHFPEAATCTDV